MRLGPFCFWICCLLVISGLFWVHAIRVTWGEEAGALASRAQWVFLLIQLVIGLCLHFDVRLLRQEEESNES